MINLGKELLWSQQVATELIANNGQLSKYRGSAHVSTCKIHTSQASPNAQLTHADLKIFYVAYYYTQTSLITPKKATEIEKTQETRSLCERPELYHIDQGKGNRSGVGRGDSPLIPSRLEGRVCISSNPLQIHPHPVGQIGTFRLLQQDICVT